MITPKLDNRTVEDILALIKEKSEFYTPEWLLDYKNVDGGAALAQLFAEMFHGTVDRYNRFPDKCYLEFLNMIGVCARSVSPAIGMAAAELVENAPHNVFIKAGTQLFTDISDEENGDKRVVFETEKGFFATPAELQAIFMISPDEDVINRTELSEDNALPLLLFKVDPAKNLERHVLAIAHSSVFRLSGLAEISLKITNSAMTYKDAQLMEQLCDPSFAQWSYFSPKGKESLSARFERDHIVLNKGEGRVVLTDDNGKATEDEEITRWIFCEMNKGAGYDEIFADHVWVNSRSVDDAETGKGLEPSNLFYNDTELSVAESGYCFGKEPQAYDSLYINCPVAFSKGGAEVTVEFTVATVILKDVVITDEVGQEFNSKMLVDKEDTKAAPPDEIYISDVQWEYWNGFGWAKLNVSGTVNPFSCHGGDGKKSISFVCPDDVSMSVQNAYEGMWIRARVREVENALSLHSRWLVPWLKSVDIHFDYGSMYLPAQTVSVVNTCEKSVFETDGSAAEMKLFSLMPDRHDSVYFKFDSAPSGYPVNLYFEFSDADDNEREVVYEYLAEEYGGRNVWRELKTEDRTHGFTNSGILSVYAPSDFSHTELFGEVGCWIRAVNISAKSGICPRLCSIRRNTVEIVQKETVPAEEHEFIAGKPWQQLALINKPVITCDLWVNELGETPLSELDELKKLNSANVRMVTDDDGQLTECWVKWEPKTSLADSDSEDRHFLMDYNRGVICFGDGKNGRIPAYSNDTAISVNYSFGGGSVGNLPAEALDGLIVSVPFVERMTNFDPTCGGSNGQSLDAIRKIGAGRLMHRGRAVTAVDFENLVMEEFTEVDEVRCFCGRNKFAVAENGSITVVVKPKDFGGATYASSLCRRIEDYLKDRASLEPVAGGRFAVIPARVMKVSVEVIVQLDDYEYAAITERAVINAINEMIGSSSGGCIGDMPSVSRVYSALKRVEHISYISRVLLTGEYYDKSEKMIVPLDGTVYYRYFIASAGTHTVRI